MFWEAPEKYGKFINNKNQPTPPPMASQEIMDLKSGKCQIMGTFAGFVSCVRYLLAQPNKVLALELLSFPDSVLPHSEWLIVFNERNYWLWDDLTVINRASNSMKSDNYLNWHCNVPDQEDHLVGSLVVISEEVLEHDESWMEMWLSHCISAVMRYWLRKCSIESSLSPRGNLRESGGHWLVIVG